MLGIEEIRGEIPGERQTPDLTPAINSTKQRRGRWKKGECGNRRGRPRGTYSARMSPLKRILDGDAKAILQATIDAAKSGDVGAQRLLLDRLLPRERLIKVALPRIRCAADALEALARILHATAAGVLSPSEGSAMAALTGRYLEIDAMQRLEERIAQLEQERST